MKPIVIAAAMLGLVLAAGPMDVGFAKAAPTVNAGDAGQEMLVADGYSFRPPPTLRRPTRHGPSPYDPGSVYRPASPRPAVPGGQCE